MSFWKKVRLNGAALMLDCRAAARAQSDAMQGPLPPARRFGLRLHLLMCKWCRRYGEQLRFLRSAAHDHQDQLTDAGPEKLSAAARARIKDRLRREKPPPAV
jgi:hypothetical protein